MQTHAQQPQCSSWQTWAEDSRPAVTAKPRLEKHRLTASLGAKPLLRILKSVLVCVCRIFAHFCFSKSCTECKHLIQRILFFLYVRHSSKHLGDRFLVKKGFCLWSDRSWTREFAPAFRENLLATRVAGQTIHMIWELAGTEAFFSSLHKQHPLTEGTHSWSSGACSTKPQQDQSSLSASEAEVGKHQSSNGYYSPRGPSSTPQV